MDYETDNRIMQYFTEKQQYGLTQHLHFSTWWGRRWIDFVSTHPVVLEVLLPGVQDISDEISHKNIKQKNLRAEVHSLWYFLGG